MRLSTDKKILGLAVLAVAVVVGAVFVMDRVQQELLPQPIAAFVAIQPAGESRAVIGRVEMEAGTSFKLLAVLEAETWDGEQIYYTDALDLWRGGQRIDGAAIRRWDRSEEHQVRWFTVEGSMPYLKIRTQQDFERFTWREVYRADWPSSWSVPGSISSTRQIAKFGEGDESIPSFGTQRYHVRIEFFGSASRIRPTLRLRSPGAESLPDNFDQVPTAVLSLPEPLRGGSTVFGLSHLELSDLSSQPALATSIGEWSRQGIVFSRLFVLRGKLDDLGLDWEDLSWQGTDLMAAELPWGGAGVAAGDLIRVGRRVVELFSDRGVIGRLDARDLCLDYEKAATISRLDEIFTGDGLVEWSASRSLAGVRDR